MKEDEAGPVVCPSSQLAMGHHPQQIVHKTSTAAVTGMDLSSPLESPMGTPVPYAEQQPAVAHKQYAPIQQFKELEDECISLREHNLKLKQQLVDSQRRERLMVRRLAAKEQELLDYVNQVAELKSVQTPAQAALKTAVLDPAVNVLFQKLKQELQATQARLEETQNELAAWKFTPDSNTGKRLMAKCRLLHQENEELGKLTSNGRLAKLESELAMQKGISDDLKKSHCDLDEVLLELEEDVEGMQNTILLMQRELKVEKERNQAMERENGKMLTVLRDNPEWLAAEQRLRVVNGVGGGAGGGVDEHDSVESGGEERMEAHEMVLRTRSATGSGGLKITSVEDHLPRGLRRTAGSPESSEAGDATATTAINGKPPAVVVVEAATGVSNNSNNGQMVTRKRTRSAVASSVVVGVASAGEEAPEEVLRPLVDVEMADEVGEEATMISGGGKRNRYSVVNSSNTSASESSNSHKATSVGCVTRTRGQMQLEAAAGAVVAVDPVKEVENGSAAVADANIAKRESGGGVVGAGDCNFVDPLRKISSGTTYNNNNNNNGSKLNIAEAVVEENGRRVGGGGGVGAAAAGGPTADGENNGSSAAAAVPSGIEQVAIKLKLENGSAAAAAAAAAAATAATTGAMDLRQEPSNV